MRVGVAEHRATWSSVLYADVREELHKAAGRSVLAHLVKLVDDGMVAVEGTGGEPRGTSRTNES